MKLFRYLLFALLAMLIFFLLFLLTATIGDYNPPEKIRLKNHTDVSGMPSGTYRMVTWNIGYAGLDASMDFFYDGGSQVRPSPEQVDSNIRGIREQLERFAGFDFILLQEVDIKSRRSYRNNIAKMAEELLPAYHSSLAVNYNTFFVPLPPLRPLGRVESGIQTLSARTPSLVVRHQFPGNYGWPTRVFMLDRCFMVHRFPVPGDKELLIINTHNSAYDDGSLRQQQMEYLRSFLLTEYASGNYIVVGGDWNQTPHGFEPEFSGDLFDEDDLSYIGSGYPAPGWSWAYDNSVPTNRRLQIPYEKGKTATTVIDFFLLSPNIPDFSVKGIDLGFRHSDHNPVVLEFRLTHKQTDTL